MPSLEESLNQLKEMHEKGLIAKEVYEERQRAILNGHPSPEVQKKIKAGISGLSQLYRLAIAAGVLFAGIYIVYHLANKEGKDSINHLVAATGVGAQVIPWSDRADTAVRAVIEGNQSVLAESVQSITHPTGASPTLLRTDTRKMGEVVLVKMTVEWAGGFTGSRYNTMIAWEFDSDSSRGVKIVSDTATFAVDAEHLNTLNEYFRTEIYPIVKARIGE